jgi:hypothetical protein
MLIAILHHTDVRRSAADTAGHPVHRRLTTPASSRFSICSSLFSQTLKDEQFVLVKYFVALNLQFEEKVGVIWHGDTTFWVAWSLLRNRPTAYGRATLGTRLLRRASLTKTVHTRIFQKPVRRETCRK